MCADITLCANLTCPYKDTCRRFTCKSSGTWQSYFLEEPYEEDTGKCSVYWPTGGEPDHREKAWGAKDEDNKK